MIGGLTPLSTSDYPGHLSAVVFCQGCPWRCGYCQNAHLVESSASPNLKWRTVLDFLERRIGLLDAVVFSGGEPTLQRTLPGAMKAVRAMGFRVGLHTSGAYPQRLASVLPLIDWIGLDIKAPFDAYESVTNAPGSGSRAKSSARLVMESGVDYEFRTTMHPTRLDGAKILTLAKELVEMGAKRYRVQEFRPKGCLDETLLGRAATSMTEAISEEINALFPNSN